MPPYDFSNKNMRRVGLSYLGNGGQPKLQLEDPTDPITDGSPPYPSPIRPTPFTKRNRPTSTYNKPVPKRLVSSSGDDDDLTSPNVPNISRPAAKSRSRQTSVDPNYGGRTADKTLGSLGGVPTGGNFKPTTYLAALTAGKVPEKAQEEALRQEPRRPEPSQVWDGFVTKRRRQPAVYYQRKGATSAYGSREKKPIPKEKTETTIFLSDSSLDSDSAASKTKPLPKAVAKKKSEAAKKTEPKKKVIADADTTPDSEAETSFINPMEAFGMNSPPVPKSKVKGRTVGSREIQKKDDTTSSHENGTAEAGYGFINPFKDMPNLGETCKETKTEKSKEKAKDSESDFLDPIKQFGPVSSNKFEDSRSSMSDKDINDITSSPQRESVTISSQSSFTEPWIPLSKADKDELELMSNMAAVAGITDIDAYKSGLNPADLNEGEERCGLCQCPLTKEFVDTWRDKIGSEIIRLGQWTEIHEAHIKKAQEEEWKAKGYPENIEWEELAGRAKKHMRWLKDIISDKVESRYRRMFKQQLKDTKGNAAMLLRQEHKLPFPGYYGPRGADIILQALMTRLGERVGGAAANDPLIARGGASAFMQHVLVPELGIRLISEDMKVDEKEAYRILEESRELGEKFNPGGNEGDMYGDDEDGDTWVDVNATQRRRSMKMDVDEWEEMDY